MPKTINLDDFASEITREIRKKLKGDDVTAAVLAQAINWHKYLNGDSPPGDDEGKITPEYLDEIRKGSQQSGGKLPPLNEETDDMATQD